MSWGIAGAGSIFLDLSQMVSGRSYTPFGLNSFESSFQSTSIGLKFEIASLLSKPPIYYFRNFKM